MRAGGAGLMVHASLLLAGCSVLYRPMLEPALRPVAASAPPISRALAYLSQRQVTAEQEAACPRDWAGNWPQYVYGPAPLALGQARDVTPFLATFVHHALALVTEENATKLGLAPLDVHRARQMRLRAVGLMRRFASRPQEGVPGTFAFWPRDPPPPRGIHALVASVQQALLTFPPGGGRYGPLNLPAFPPAHRIWPDADGTSVIRVALLEHAEVDGGAPGDGSFADVLSRWRHDGRASVHGAAWLQVPNGAFLTYVGHPRTPAVRNDVDLIVNANVLFALGRYGRTDVSGVPEAVDFILGAIETGHHRPIRCVSTYYPDNHILAYTVARAWRLGGVEALRPAVDRLADEIETEAMVEGNGRVHWTRGGRELSTAFAALALLHAGRRPDLVAGAARWLLDRQDPRHGSWRPGTLFYGRSDQGFAAGWRSTAMTTAVALELLVRRRLLVVAEPGDAPRLTLDDTRKYGRSRTTLAR